MIYVLDTIAFFSSRIIAYDLQKTEKWKRILYRKYNAMLGKDLSPICSLKA